MAIKCFLRGVLDFSPKMTYKIEINNSSFSHLKYNGQGWHLLSVNATPHLKKEHLPDLYSAHDPWKK